MNECDDVLVTGPIESERGRPVVKELRAQVATVYPDGHEEHDFFKVWPVDDKDPQLPKGHDGKLWFRRSLSTVVVLPDTDS